MIGGALPSPEDARDFRLSRCMDMPAGGANLPSSFSCYIPERIRDQGQVNSCTAHAMATILSCISHKLYGEELSFSAGFLYGNRRETDYKGAGEIMRDVPKKAAKWGDVPDTVWENTSEGVYGALRHSAFCQPAHEQNRTLFRRRLSCPCVLSIRHNGLFVRQQLGKEQHSLCYGEKIR